MNEITEVPKTGYGILPWNDIQRLSEDLNRKIDVCFDVGANDGDTSLSLLDNFKTAQVYSFEPHPITFSELTNRIKSERFCPYQIALSDTESERRFYTYEGISLVNSLAPNARFAERFKLESSEIIVKSTTVDNFCSKNKIEEIDVLKIDTEGFDLCVLKGAEKMLSEGRIGFVYTEFNDCLEKPGMMGGSLNKISEYLAHFNFHFVATYTDFIMTKGEIFVAANLLMVRTD
jgi:FkbM family methyltransferase